LSLTGTRGTICSSDGLYPVSGSSAVLRRSHHTTQRDPRTRNLQANGSQPTQKVQQGQGKPQHGNLVNRIMLVMLTITGDTMTRQGPSHQE